MKNSFATSLRRALAFAGALILLGSPRLLSAQVAAADTALVEQANTALTAQADAASPATVFTRITLSQRHEKLIELFAKHPELARTYALNAKTRAFLLKAEPSYAALVEQDTPVTGELVSSVADDFTHHTSSSITVCIPGRGIAVSR